MNRRQFLDLKNSSLNLNTHASEKETFAYFTSG